jgi:endonuclease-3
VQKKISRTVVVRVLERLTAQQGKTMLARLGPGQPFRSLVTTILSARARDEVTEHVAADLLKVFPNASALAAARPTDVEKLLRHLGLYRIKSRRLVAVARALVEKYHGKVPNTLEELIKLPGVGRKTAGCVVVYAFSGTALPVDTHVHRISNRLGWVATKNPEATEMALKKVVPREWWSRVNDLLVHHGKTICKPIRPDCPICPVSSDCPCECKSA